MTAAMEKEIEAKERASFESAFKGLPEQLEYDAETDRYLDIHTHCAYYGWQLARSLAESPQVPEWVAVDDQVPAHGGAVLVFVDLGSDCDPVISTASYSETSEKWNIHDAGASPENSDDITHWMPLPAPPPLPEEKA